MGLKHEERIVGMQAEFWARRMACVTKHTQVIIIYIFVQNTHNLGQFEVYTDQIAPLEVQSAEVLIRMDASLKAQVMHTVSIKASAEKANPEKLKLVSILKKLVSNTGEFSGDRCSDNTARGHNAEF